MEEKSHDNFHAQIQCELTNGDTCNEKSDKFISAFSRSTNTNWIVNKTFPTCSRHEFRKLYTCHLSKKNKKDDKKYGCNRNYNCKASINIKFLKVTPITQKRSTLLREGKSVVITINYDHSHRVKVSQAYSLLRCSVEAKESFYRYFDSGMTPAAAKTYHELHITEDCNEDLGVLLANAQINPTERQITYLYEQWRNEKYGARDEQSVTERIKLKMEELQMQDAKLCITENPLVVVIITPVMRRSFEAGLADEMIFVDTSGSCDQSSTCVTFIFAATKIGAIPVTVILHRNKSERDYLLALKLAKQNLETSCEKMFEPQVIMTDDDTAERNALKVMFPKARLLLCIFHVMQATWRWLWDGKNGVNKIDRRPLMLLFRRILFAKSTSDAESFMLELLNNDILKNYDNTKAYFEIYWTRREEWSLPYRSNVLHRGNNTNNYCEASIRIFKDVILQRCKVFNICALIDFITSTFENYHRNRLLKFANNRGRNLTLAYEKFCKHLGKIEQNQIKQISDTLYEVKENEDSECCQVDIENEFCDCFFGQGGAYCKHLCAVEQKYGVFLKKSLLLTKIDRQEFVKIALGEKHSTNFYDNIDDIDGTDCNDNHVDTTIVALSGDVPQHISDSQAVGFNLPIVETTNQSSTKVVEELRHEFMRLTDILVTDKIGPSNSALLKKCIKTLQKIKTSSQIMSLLSHSIKHSKGRKIRVQPTSVARRKDRGLQGSRRVQSGRPTKHEKKKSVRPHNISINIEKNQASAKKH